MKLFHKIDQETCNGLSENVGLTAECYYIGGVDLLNAGFVDAAYQQLCSIKFACFREGAEVPTGVLEFEEAIARAKSTGWTGDPDHWRHADISFSDERDQVFRKMTAELDEFIQGSRPVGLRVVGLGSLEVLDQTLASVRRRIAPALKRDKEIEETRRKQNALTTSDTSTPSSTRNDRFIHPPLRRTLDGDIQLQYEGEVGPVTAQGEQG